MRKLSTSFLGISLALTAACGDNGGTDGDDDADAAPPDVDAPPATDAGPDAPPAYVPPTPVAVALSPAGPDQLQSAVAGPGGTFYAAGFSAPTVAGARLVTVVKLTAAGALDTTWGGGDGIVATTLEFRGGNGEIGIGVQPSGKIVVSATVANLTNASDTDVAVTRVNADGTPDALFGVAGVRRLDLSTAHDNNGTLVAKDAARGVAIDANGVIYVYALSRADGTVSGGGPRTDHDLTAVKLDLDGTQDMGFADDGEFNQDVQNISEVARGINVIGDGVLLSGYANSPGLGSVQPLLVKLTAAGALDTAFNTTGIWHEAVLAMQTEIYNVAVHGTHFVTAGYGRASGTQNDWVSLRYNATTGARDTTFGGAPNGAVVIDASGNSMGDNCRNAIALPGGRTLLIGSTGSGSPARDGVFGVLSATGTLDPVFGGQVHKYQLGTNGDDQFWGGAVSGTNAILVGYRGSATPMAQTEADNDNAYAVVLPLP
jgi:uncharacterized delta-60 repeat protein